jgi:hypothetical protein
MDFGLRVNDIGMNFLIGRDNGEAGVITRSWNKAQNDQSKTLNEEEEWSTLHSIPSTSEGGEEKWRVGKKRGELNNRENRESEAEDRLAIARRRNIGQDETRKPRLFSSRFFNRLRCVVSGGVKKGSNNRWGRRCNLENCAGFFPSRVFGDFLLWSKPILSYPWLSINNMEQMQLGMNI